MTKQTETQSSTLSLVETSQALVVIDDDTYSAAADQLSLLKDAKKQIADVFDPPIDAAHKAHKAALAAKKKVEGPRLEAERFVKGIMGAYVDRKEEEKRRKERELQAEMKRREDEAKLERAIELEAEGKETAAVEVLDAPSYVPEVDLGKAAPETESAQTRKSMTFNVVDVSKLPTWAIQPDLQAIRSHLQKMKKAGQEPALDGVEVKYKTVIASV